MAGRGFSEQSQTHLFCLQIFDTELKEQEREVCFIDIAYDEIPERYYKESEVSLWGCECADAHGYWELTLLKRWKWAVKSGNVGLKRCDRDETV